MVKNSTRFIRSTCTSLENNSSKKNNSKQNITKGPKDETLENIISYSRASKAIKTNSSGIFLTVLN